MNASTHCAAPRTLLIKRLASAMTVLACGALSVPAPAGAITLAALSEMDDLGYECMPETLLEAAFAATDKLAGIPQTCLPKPCARQIEPVELAALMGRDPSVDDWDLYVARYAQVCVDETDVAWGGPELLTTASTREGPLLGGDTDFWAPILNDPVFGADIAGTAGGGTLTGASAPVLSTGSPRPQTGAGIATSGFGGFGGFSGGSRSGVDGASVGTGTTTPLAFDPLDPAFAAAAFALANGQFPFGFAGPDAGAGATGQDAELARAAARLAGEGPAPVPLPPAFFLLIAALTGLWGRSAITRQKTP